MGGVDDDYYLAGERVGGVDARPLLVCGGGEVRFFVFARAVFTFDDCESK